jgi:ribosomal protein S19E (S16A)
MDAEFDYDLSAALWETLKALRLPARERRIIRPSILAELAALGLVTVNDEQTVITARGRKVLIRGSSKLLDLAA